MPDLISSSLVGGQKPVKVYDRDGISIGTNGISEYVVLSSSDLSAPIDINYSQQTDIEIVSIVCSGTGNLTVTRKNPAKNLPAIALSTGLIQIVNPFIVAKGWTITISPSGTIDYVAITCKQCAVIEEKIYK